MLRSSWKYRVTNDEVFRRMGTSNVLLGDIVRRLCFLWHVLQKDELEKLVVTGFVDGKRAKMASPSIAEAEWTLVMRFFFGYLCFI